MRIACPFCGERGISEFSYRGDATPRRPSGDGAEDAQAWENYVYLRDNVAGPMLEHWYHAGGCHAWLEVTRNVLTHEILAVKPAHQPQEPQTHG